ncbi:MAG: histone deacetylase [Anaerolineae bacterium]|nr:histone deacetylase [Anaerolineae bacterium]
MKAYYTDIFVLPLPPGHRFPMMKYKLLRERLISEGVMQADELIVPEAATDEDILRCHTPEYLHKLMSGTLSRKEETRIGFPWTPQMVERSRRSSGATIRAAMSALKDGTSANLAGGTHHAGRDFGAGFSVFCDAAIAARSLQNRGLVEKVLVVDCDVHQGNGTADICNGDASIFTFSIHGEKNYPFRKIDGDLDIGLADGTSDEDYLTTLQVGLERVLSVFDPDLAIYQSGADPFIGDRLGKLSLTKAGLAARDRLVLRMLRNEHIPVAVTMGGGYASDVHDVVDIHFETIKIAKSFCAAE